MDLTVMRSFCENLQLKMEKDVTIKIIQRKVYWT